MYIRSGRFECFVGKDYVHRAKRKLFSGLSIEAGNNGGKEYECLFMGYLCQLSISSPPSVNKSPNPNTH